MGAPVFERVRLPAGVDPELQRALTQLQSNIDQALRRMVSSNPLLGGVEVEGKTLLDGPNFIQHGLGRSAKGYIVTSQDAAGSVFLSSAPNPRPESHIALETDSPQMTVSLWVF
jgi:hypothetical protein